MMKPILFNTEMVKAILEGRKTVTRRVAKITVNRGDVVNHNSCTNFNFDINMFGKCVNFYNEKEFYQGASQKNIEVGDILYVRETYFSGKLLDQNEDVIDYNCVLYAADEDRKDIDYNSIKWKPSIHMPKEAARIFLKVTGVRVERLQDITEGQANKEGVESTQFSKEGMPLHFSEFIRLWDSTVKDDHYKWKSNPWVWVVEFEQIEKQEIEK